MEKRLFLLSAIAAAVVVGAVAVKKKLGNIIGRIVEEIFREEY